MKSSVDVAVSTTLLDVRTSIRTDLLLHPLFQQTRDGVLESLETNPLVLLAGPAGVGKGRLVEAIRADLNLPVRDDARFLRAAVVRASNPHRRAFSWRAFFIACLEALSDPLPEDKVQRATVSGTARPAPGARAYRGTEEALRRALFSAVRDRGLEVLFVDEAFALVQHEAGRTLRSQLDVLRDLSDTAGCGIVLVSTYRILAPIDLSGELARRMAHVFFPRYRQSEGRTDIRGFRSVVKALIDQLGEASALRLGAHHLDLLFAGSLGCVGVLVPWFVRAITRCIKSRASAVDWSHFEATVLADVPLATLLRECEAGESRVADLTARTFGASLAPSPLADQDTRGDCSASDPVSKPAASSGRPAVQNPRRPSVS